MKTVSLTKKHKYLLKISAEKFNQTQILVKVWHHTFISNNSWKFWVNLLNRHFFNNKYLYHKIWLNVIKNVFQEKCDRKEVCKSTLTMWYFIRFSHLAYNCSADVFHAAEIPSTNLTWNNNQTYSHSVSNFKTTLEFSAQFSSRLSYPVPFFSFFFPPQSTFKGTLLDLVQLFGLFMSSVLDC